MKQDLKLNITDSGYRKHVYIDHIHGEAQPDIGIAKTEYAAWIMARKKLKSLIKQIDMELKKL